MKVSVIIPYHRGEAYLRDCLDSLKEQTEQVDFTFDLEILLLCDHTKEEDLSSLSDYQKVLPIRVFHLRKNTGVAAARNLGLSKATGDYIYFLDSDDYLYDNALGKLMKMAAEREEDIVYGKKKSSWLGRSAYLVKLQEQENTDSDEEEEEQSSVDAESLNLEDGTVPDQEQQEETALEGSDASDSEQPLNESLNEDLLTEADVDRLYLQNQAYRILVARRKGVRNISVLNILFKRSFIEEHGLRFPKDVKYFSDVPFLLEALSRTDRLYPVLTAIYIKRRHNDAINFPSLSQVRDPIRFYEFLDTYYETAGRIPENSELRQLLDRKYISYYAEAFAPKLKRSKNDIWREDNFEFMRNIVCCMRPEVLKELKGYRGRIIRALLNENRKASVRIATAHLAHLKLKQMMKNKRVFLSTLYTHFFLQWPVRKDWVLFESFFGKSYSDSPKYIYEYLSKQFPGKYRMIWVIDKQNTKIPYRNKKIKRFSLQYYYYLARCGYLVFNGRQPEWTVKRKECTFLQTWHGTPLKKLVFDMEEITSATPQYKQQVYKQSRAWDYLIAPNEFCNETFRRCFLFENEMLTTGYPRNDILHAPNKEDLSKRIRARLGIPRDKKTILYAPTWRDDEFYGKGQYKFELHLDLKLMQERLGSEYVILLRTHYFIADSIDVSSLKGFAYNVSNYDDISELYLISDILITDYSSVFFDYANLRRPMLFFTYDLDKYRDILRGFYFDIEKEVPGPLLFTTEEVIEAVNGIEALNREYSQRYDEFYHRFCDWEDGHAAEKVVKSVFVDD